MENDVGQQLFDKYTRHPRSDYIFISINSINNINIIIHLPVDPCTVTVGENLNVRGIKLQVPLRLWSDHLL